MTGEEIRANLTHFVARWSVRDGYEKGEAQLFLNELFACYGQDLATVARFEQFQSGGFIDLSWPEVCIIEMKSAGEAKHLAKHRDQALRYWREAARPEDNVPAPPYVVLCAFEKFEVWEPGRFPGSPRVEFSLEDLPDRYTALQFLAGGEPIFTARQEAVTLETAGALGELFHRLEDRHQGDSHSRRLFILQVVWCMFAEDLGQIPGQGFTRVVDDLLRNPQRSSADDLGRLFELLNDPSPKRPEHGIFEGVPYVNGSLFAEPSRLDLEPEELKLLREVAASNWRKVQPSIFGSLLQDVFGRDKQWQLGAHYTHESEIQKVVIPTIVEPWMERIGALAKFADAQQAQADLLNYVVLDPACGSGNFLYVAYRELRKIEVELARRTQELALAEGRPAQQGLSAFFPLQNMRGIELEQFGVDLARVTLWMGHRLAVEELELSESTLPLADLSGVRRADALRTKWDDANAIIGNPPYHGSQNLRGILDEDYVEWLKREFGAGLKDLCVYWFRRAADQMGPDARAGLVGTNSISQNRARGASLNYVVEKGGVITDAVSRQKWPGEAVVNVSIVNWVQQPSEPPERFVLDGEQVVGINTRLRESKVAIEEYEALPPNLGRSFQGPIPAGNFYLDPDEARDILAREDADYAVVVRPYLVGDDITEEPEQRPRRYIIDFGMRSLEEAMAYPEALRLVRERVKPKRDENNREAYRRYWWRFAEPRPKMHGQLDGLKRYIAGNRIGKRFLFCWTDASVCPSDLTIVFAFDDDYAMGILTSSIHGAWAHSESSTLEDRPRYTPTSCFETFPWPQPEDAARGEIGELAKSLIDSRQEICVNNEIGLTALYNQVEENAWAHIADMHRQLDEAVARAYGWPASVAHDPVEAKARLADLYRQISEGLDYAPFGVPNGATW
ncbi:MAG TPA: DNA methyltransferase [Solirubrobacterales bacterium]|nr:DNA methyltransferase [Solirubrobacterales bacterium]